MKLTTSTQLDQQMRTRASAKLSPAMASTLLRILELGGRVRTDSIKSYGYTDGTLETQRPVPAVQMRGLIARKVLVPFRHPDQVDGKHRGVYWYIVAPEFGGPDQAAEKKPERPTDAQIIALLEKAVAVIEAEADEVFDRTSTPFVETCKARGHGDYVAAIAGIKSGSPKVSTSIRAVKNRRGTGSWDLYDANSNNITETEKESVEEFRVVRAPVVR